LLELAEHVLDKMLIHPMESLASNHPRPPIIASQCIRPQHALLLHVSCHLVELTEYIVDTVVIIVNSPLNQIGRS